MYRSHYMARAWRSSDTKRCTCNKNNLICSEMCFCQDCENQPIFSEELLLNNNKNEDNENGTDDIDDWDY